MYNASPFINRCIDSIINQGIDQDGYEILIINDGSTDDSLRKVEKYQNSYPNVRIITQKNQGQSIARNRGIKEAKGRYLWFIDADDFLIPNSLKKVYESIFVTTQQLKNRTAQEYATCDIITFNVIKGPDKDYNKTQIYHTTPSYSPIQKGSEFIVNFPDRFPNGPWWYFIRKEFIDNHGILFHEGKLLEDGLFIITALLSADKVGYVSQTLYYYALRPGSTMYTYTPSQLEKINDGFRNAISYLTNLLEEKKTSIGKACYDRLIARRNGYVVFLLIRLLKYSHPKYAKETLACLKRDNLYPIRNLIGKDYKSWRMKSVHMLINKEWIYLSSCQVYRVIKACKHYLS